MGTTIPRWINSDLPLKLTFAGLSWTQTASDKRILFDVLAWERIDLLKKNKKKTTQQQQQCIFTKIYFSATDCSNTHKFMHFKFTISCHSAAFFPALSTIQHLPYIDPLPPYLLGSQKTSQWKIRTPIKRRMSESEHGWIVAHFQTSSVWCIKRYFW